MKSKIKQEKGITLIALVVTIIVLLILAGISINALAGQNGILNRAVESKEKTEVAQKDEMEKLVRMEALGCSAGDKITNPSSYGKNSSAQATADGDGKYFALPDGATYVTGTVDTGVVVDIKGSEFVWVPVDDVVLDTSKEAKLPKSESAGTSSGMTYTPMAVRVENNYEGILYKFSGSNGYLCYPNNENYQGRPISYREPDVVNDYDGGRSDTVGIKLSNLTSEYNALIESVLKYKGFYVARYEAGLDENKNIVFKDASVAENKVTTADASNNETKTWYGLYKKIKTFTTDSDKFVSSMIWGSQYDAMMNWMAKNGKTVGNADYLKRNDYKITGRKPKDVINNVYDLYGCNLEWTLENDYTLYRVLRGGHSRNGDTSNTYAPSSRYSFSPNSPQSYDDPNGSYYTFSSRATLYIKCNV